MVRLKVSPSIHSVLIQLYFNSTMVRLKESRTKSRLDLRKFQFHYGTIKSETRTLNATSMQDFNSTMVRLKVYEGGMSDEIVLFQFHYGTIKSS